MGALQAHARTLRDTLNSPFVVDPERWVHYIRSGQQPSQLPSVPANRDVYISVHLGNAHWALVHLAQEISWTDSLEGEFIGRITAIQHLRNLINGTPHLEKSRHLGGE